MLGGNIWMGLVFKYHYSGDVALKRNFDKRTIKTEEFKKKNYSGLYKYISWKKWLNWFSFSFLVDIWFSERAEAPTHKR